MSRGGELGESMRADMEREMKFARFCTAGVPAPTRENGSPFRSTNRGGLLHRLDESRSGRRSKLIAATIRPGLSGDFANRGAVKNPFRENLLGVFQHTVCVMRSTAMIGEA